MSETENRTFKKVSKLKKAEKSGIIFKKYKEDQFCEEVVEVCKEIIGEDKEFEIYDAAMTLVNNQNSEKLFDLGVISENCAKKIDELAKNHGIRSNLQEELKETQELNEITYYEELENDKKLQYLKDKRMEKIKELANLGVSGSMNLEEKEREIKTKIKVNQKESERFFVTKNTKEELNKENQKLEQQLTLINDIQEIERKYEQVSNEINEEKQQTENSISISGLKPPKITQDQNKCVNISVFGDAKITEHQKGQSTTNLNGSIPNAQQQSVNGQSFLGGN